MFGSPYSPRVGMWAFSYDRQGKESSGKAGAESNNPKASTAADLWSAIPFDTDIVITHTPPYTHCNESLSKRRALGCEDLRRALWRVRPKLAVCGHVHEGRGAERVRWDVLGVSGLPYSELGVTRWQDPGAWPGNSKMSFLDLTSRGGKQPLDHDGSPLRRGWPADRRAPNEVCQHFPDDNKNATATALPGFGTQDVGGSPDVSVRCDVQALCCRLGRRETCVVNCAIAATNWPHTGGKKFNKPIVVDLDLPILEEDDGEGSFGEDVRNQE